MRIFHALVLIIFVQSFYGLVRSLRLRPPTVFNYNPKDPKIVSELSTKLESITPEELKYEKGMSLERLFTVHSQDARRTIWSKPQDPNSGVYWTYEFEARGLSSKLLYDCKLVLLLERWKGPEKIHEFECRNSRKS